MNKLLLFFLGVFAGAATAADGFDIRNEAEFKKCVAAAAVLEKLAGDMNFLEGPQWFPGDGGYLIFSDIPANEMKRWTPLGGVATFRRPSQNANGNTMDNQGRLVSAEHSGRRVSVTENDGTVNTIADKFDGKKLNSPNDVVVKSDGTVWFTDPDYGLSANPQIKQKATDREQEGNFVFRFDPKNKNLTAVARDFDKPNGLAFSPDERLLYVADSGTPGHIRVFEVQPDGTLKGGRVFCKIDKGRPDGIRCDAEGRVWSSAGDGVHIFAPDGGLIGKIPVPEVPANLCFGGKDLRTLFITARKSLYSIPVLAEGAVKK